MKININCKCSIKIISKLLYKCVNKFCININNNNITNMPHIFTLWYKWKHILWFTIFIGKYNDSITINIKMTLKYLWCNNTLVYWIYRNK